MKFKEVTVKKYSRKTGQCDRLVKPFEKYQIVEIKVCEKSQRRIVRVQGPKQEFYLMETVRPLKVFVPEQPVKELPLFSVASKSWNFNAKIQGACYFALENDVLIPYRQDGRGCVCEAYKW